MSENKTAKSLGHTLGHLRLTAGMSIAEASDAFGCEPGQLEAIEKGENAPGLLAINQLSTIYSRKIAGRQDETPEQGPPSRKWETLPCAVRGCADGFHRWADGEQDDTCCCIRIGDKARRGNDAWLVAGYLDRETGIWEAYADDIDLGRLTGAAGLVTLERFVTAYRAVQQHCDHLNELNSRAELGHFRGGSHVEA